MKILKMLKQILKKFLTNQLSNVMVHSYQNIIALYALKLWFNQENFFVVIDSALSVLILIKDL